MLATAAAIFSVLLIITGAAKVARPHDVSKALTDLGLPRMPGIGVVLGIAEIVIGAGALLVPGVLVVQGIAYLAFAVWVFAALRANVPIASCGCLGRDDTPPTVAHVVMNVLAGVLSFGAALGDGLIIDSVFQGAAQVVVIAVGVFLASLVLNQAAQLVGAGRS